MGDPARIPEMIKTLEAVWTQNPDWRLGQLIDNMSTSVGRVVFYIEDDVLHERMLFELDDGE